MRRRYAALKRPAIEPPIMTAPRLRLGVGPWGCGMDRGVLGVYRARAMRRAASVTFRRTFSKSLLAVADCFDQRPARRATALRITSTLTGLRGRAMRPFNPRT